MKIFEKSVNKSFIRDFLFYAKHNRIIILPESRKFGIVATLIGWFLIALSTVLFQNSIVSMPSSVNFFIQFFSATIILFFACLFQGVGFFKIREIEKTKLELKNFHDYTKNTLSVLWRRNLIYFRGAVAILGYMAYSLSRVGTSRVDNSALFSVDAIFYAVILYWVFKEKFSVLQISGLFIAFLGVCLIFSFDFGSISAITTGFIGVFASGALAVIILLNLVVVQHDYPLRIAFYQCFIGLIIASVFLSIHFLFDRQLLILYPTREIICSGLAGIAYAVALLFFFNAFLYTESFIIAVLGYSLVPFVELLYWLITNEKIHSVNILSPLMISVGGGLSIYSEYRKDKKKKIHLIGSSSYLPSLVAQMKNLRKEFNQGNLDWYEYMSQRHEFNKLLFCFAEELAGTDMKNIDISRDQILFTLAPYNIKMESDGACRSAPLEILNFGQYEAEESKVLFQLIQDGMIILDIGAHIGWHSVSFAKKFPTSEIYSFEPIPNTFSFLEKNIQHNAVKNIHVFNYGLSNESKDVFFHYFKGGSALASQANLIEHDKTKKIQCRVERLDDVFSSLGAKKIDFIKCDIEGGELAAIQGSMEVIKKFLPIIFIELYEEWCRKFNYSANDVLSLLTGFGYLCFSAEKGHLKKEESIKNENNSYNYFFLHKEKHRNLIEKYSW
jgi:FkbM family methyltransferase